MFDNDNPADRKNLIHALEAVGLDAWELNSGGGIMHVIVTLLDATVDPPIVTAQSPVLRANLETALKLWPHDASLYIATNSLRTSCEIGLMGNDGRTDAQVASNEWQHAGSLEEAKSTIRQHWNERDRWLQSPMDGTFSQNDKSRNGPRPLQC